MIDVTLLGWFVGTLTSTLSLLLLLAALGAAAFVGVTALQAAEAAAGKRQRGARAGGAGSAIAALGVAMVGLRVGAGAGELVPTAAVAVAGAAAIGAGVAGAWRIGARGVRALAAARERRRAAARSEWEERRYQREVGERAQREGHDLRDEVAAADAAVERLRAAVTTLENARAAIQTKLDAATGAAEERNHVGGGEDRNHVGVGEDRNLGGGEAAGASELAAELTGARDEVGLKLEMGQRVLAAAEAAALRIACNEPLRRLLRGRPRAATQALAAAGVGGAAGPSGEALGAATASIEAFLGEVRVARVEVVEVARRRGNAAPPDGTETPASLALRELAAMEAAYGALLERLHLAELRLSTRAGVAEVESAAGALSMAARAAAVDPAALGALVTEVARAEAAVATTAPEAGSSRALAEALAAGSAALDRSDAASLWDLIVALREMR